MALQAMQVGAGQCAGESLTAVTGQTFLSPCVWEHRLWGLGNHIVISSTGLLWVLAVWQHTVTENTSNGLLLLDFLSAS